MASKEVRAALREPFPVSDVRQRPGGGTKLDYVPIEKMIGRVLDATANEEKGYAWVAQVTHFENQDGSYVAVVTGQLMIDGDVGTGTGAMVNKDPDMAVKSANSEAFKNALKNGFGTGLELWDAEHRAALGTQRRLIEGDAAAMKAEVTKIAREKLGKSKVSAREVADLFGVTAGALQDEDVLKAILEDEGLL